MQGAACYVTGREEDHGGVSQMGWRSNHRWINPHLHVFPRIPTLSLREVQYPLHQGALKLQGGLLFTLTLPGDFVVVLHLLSSHSIAPCRCAI